MTDFDDNFLRNFQTLPRVNHDLIDLSSIARKSIPNGVFDSIPVSGDYYRHDFNSAADRKYFHENSNYCYGFSSITVSPEDIDKKFDFDKKKKMKETDDFDILILKDDDDDDDGLIADINTNDDDEELFADRDDDDDSFAEYDDNTTLRAEEEWKHPTEKVMNSAKTPDKVDYNEDFVHLTDIITLPSLIAYVLSSKSYPKNVRKAFGEYPDIFQYPFNIDMVMTQMLNVPQGEFITGYQNYFRFSEEEMQAKPADKFKPQIEVFYDGTRSCLAINKQSHFSNGEFTTISRFSNIKTVNDKNVYFLQPEEFLANFTDQKQFRYFYNIFFDRFKSDEEVKEYTKGWQHTFDPNSPEGKAIMHLDAVRTSIGFEETAVKNMKSFISEGKFNHVTLSESLKIGDRFIIRGKECDEFEMPEREYVLRYRVTDVGGIKTDCAIIQQVSGEPQNKIWSLSKIDCKVLGIPFEKGLQIFSSNLDVLLSKDKTLDDLKKSQEKLEALRKEEKLASEKVDAVKKKLAESNKDGKVYPCYEIGEHTAMSILIRNQDKYEALCVCLTNMTTYSKGNDHFVSVDGGKHINTILFRPKLNYNGKLYDMFPAYIKGDKWFYIAFKPKETEHGPWYSPIVEYDGNTFDDIFPGGGILTKLHKERK